MAKRAPIDERPFNPIESALVERVSSRLPPQASRSVSEMAAEPPVIEHAVSLSKRPPREKRVLLSWEEELALQRLLDQLSATLQTPAKLSNALRSCVILLGHAQEPIIEYAARKGHLARPANNDQSGISLFEQQLAAIFQSGFSAAGGKPTE